MITDVLIDGAPIPTGLVVADITVLHGRRAVRDAPEASSATVLIVGPGQGMPSWPLSAPLVLAGPAGPMFTGRIVERRLEHGRAVDGAAYGLLSLVAAGPVAALGYRNVGDEPWPAESGAVRAERILTLAEVPYRIDGSADPIVLARDVDSRPARDLLAELAESTAAAVVDLPTGEVLYQPFADRARPVHPFPWADFEPDFEWAGFDPAHTWDDFRTWYSQDSEFPIVIPPGAVEWEPTWTASDSDVLNHVRIGYGPEPPEGGAQPWVEITDQASIAKYGRRYRYFGSELADIDDALAHAQWLITTRAEAHWKLADVIVHLDLLDEATRLSVVGLVCGDHVTIPGMPLPAPEHEGQGIVEGWTYIVWGVDGTLYERMILHLSSLLESLAVPMWADHPAAFEWAGYSPLHTWADLTDLTTVGA